MSNKMPGRIPFENIAEKDACKSWSLPEVNGPIVNHDEQRKRRTEQSKKRAEKNKRTEKENPATCEDIDTPPEVTATKITAQQLQEITQAAEQDGYEKGYQEGVAQGKIDGRKAGFSDGLKAGTEQAQSEHGQWLKEQGQHLGTLCENLFEPLQNQQQDLANATLDLAMSLAQYILDTELSIHPEKIINLVDAALSALPSQEKNIELIMHPQDAEAYQEFGPSMAKHHNIRTDQTLARGSCIVRSENSFVDYSVAQRLGEFLKALQEHPFDEEAACKPVIEPERNNNLDQETAENPNKAVQNFEEPEPELKQAHSND